MKKYPPPFMKLYDLFVEFSEKVDRVIGELEKEQDRVSKKIMELMEAEGEYIDTAALAEDALADENTPPPKEDKKYWDHQKGMWVNEKPVPIGKSGLPEPELDF